LQQIILANSAVFFNC